jgi:hypothetical protein
MRSSLSFIQFFFKSTNQAYFVLWTILILLISSCEDERHSNEFKIQQVYIGSSELSLTEKTFNIPTDQSITLIFSSSVSSLPDESIQILHEGQIIDFAITQSSSVNTVLLYPTGPFNNGSEYTIRLTDKIKSESGIDLIPIDLTFQTEVGRLKLIEFLIDDINAQDRVTNVSFDPNITILFNSALKSETISTSVFSILNESQSLPISITLDPTNTRVSITTNQELEYLTKYTIVISDFLEGKSGETFPGYTQTFYTTPDSPPKFPVISDEELLTKVQQQTFRYFYDFAHPASGMARERNTSGDLVTSGGSGFGIMSLIVGMERGFITREQGLTRLDKILDFLETCDRFHGAWPHWINGNTGKAIPFSANDNGADLVETSFLIQGLLTMRQYLNTSVAAEQQLIGRINTLWQTVEWDWFTRGNQNVLYWHWSADKGWTMNMTISGYNESLITYVLAAASPSHTISQTVYTNGWARNGGIRNNKTFYNIKLPVGYDFGGPLFFTHYSFLGIDPTNLQDAYANYWEQNVNHSLINRAYCIANPKKFVGYSAQSWGLTASDNHLGYSAHSPTNDLGVISPTAALSSMPYTPAESMEALRFFYYTMGDRLWGDYGFYDAFNVTEGWVANSYLAIDQGPIIVMIENHRTGLLWNLFMSAPEVQTGLTKLGFTY